MAESPQDYPENHTISAKLNRTIGEDKNGRGALSVFAGEFINNITCGKDFGNMVFVAGLSAVALVPVSLIGGGIIDLDPPAQTQLAGKFNLINGYAITKVEGVYFGLIHGEDGRFEVYTIGSGGPNGGDWTLIQSPEQARQYARLAVEAYNASLAQETLPEADGNPLPRTYYTTHISVPFAQDDVIAREGGQLTSSKRENETMAAYFTRSRDFWQSAAEGITPQNYGVPQTGLLEYTSDYSYWSNVGTVYKTGGEWLGLGLLGLATVLSIGGTAQQVSRRRKDPTHRP